MSDEDIYFNDKEHNRSAVHRSRHARQFSKLRKTLKGSNPNNPLRKNLSKDVSSSRAKPSVTPDQTDRVTDSAHLSSLLYKPESGVDYAALFDQLGDKSDSILNNLENICLLCDSLSQCTTSRHMASTVLLYIKSITNRSLGLCLLNYLKEVLGDLTVPDVPDNEFISESGFSDVISALKGASKNFTLLANNPAFQKVSYLVSACVCLGLCEASTVKWTLAGITLFNPNVYQRHIHASDLVGAVIDTVIYFVEGGWEFFTTGSFAGFIYSDNRVQALQEDFNFLRSHSVHFRTGMLEKATGMSNQEFHSKIESTLDSAKRISRLSTGAEKAVIDRVVSQLHDLMVEFNSTRVQGGIRAAPMVIFLQGETGVGKSTLACALPPIIGAYNGFDGGPNCTATRRGDDKYDSNIRGSTNVILLEDVANTNPEFMQISPTDSVIMICNNAIAYANMAEVELKGKIPIEPKLVIITSNMEDMGAKIGSSEPTSITRRAPVTVRVRIKEEFKKDGGISLDSNKVTEYYAARGLPVAPLPDVFELDITEPIAVPSGTVRGKAETKYRYHLDLYGNRMRNVSINAFVRWLKEYSLVYYNSQRELVSRVNNLHNEIHMCDRCHHVNLVCECPPIVDCFDDPNYVRPDDFSDAVSVQVESGFSDVLPKDWKEISTLPTIDGVKNLAYTVAFTTAKESAPFLIKYLPDCVYVFLMRTLLKLFTRGDIGAFCSHALILRICAAIWFGFVSLILLLCHSFENEHYYFEWKDETLTVLRYAVIMFGVTSIFCATSARFYYTRALVLRERSILESFRSRQCIINAVYSVRKVRTEHMLAGSLVLYMAYKAVKRLVNLKNMLDIHPQGSLSPEKLEDVFARDKEVNIWAKCSVSDRPMDRRLTTATTEQVNRKVFNNLCFLHIKEGNKHRKCDAFFVRTGLALIPYHMLFPGADPNGTIPETQHFTFYRKGEDCVSATFECYLSPTNFHRVGNKDLVVLSVDNTGGDFADLEYLLSPDLYSGLCTFIYKDLEGNLRDEATTITSGEVAHIHCSFPGSKYHLPGGTGPGLCMGVLVSQDKERRIVGFHLGGKADLSGFGISGHISGDEFRTAVEALRERRIIPHCSGTFPEGSFGIPLITTTEINARSPVNFLPLGSRLTVYGSCHGGVTATSRVLQSLISDAVGAVMKYEQAWGPPKLKPSYYAWQSNLVGISNPGIGMSPATIEWAKQDYLKPILAKIAEHQWVRDIIRPLTWKQTINGIPGERFIDKMTMDTSIGFPLSGPKTEYLVPDEPDTIYTDNPVTFNQEVWDEVYRAEELLAKGERAYLVYKACIKDEPTRLDKDKAPRLINAAPIAKQLLERKYFLGMTRFINLFPFLCESMVGINCMGPEWQTRRDYFTNNGTELNRTFGVDFKRFDQSLDRGVILATYRMYIDMCAASGNYTPRELHIMSGLATESAYPFVAFNGTMVEYPGGNISGTTLTVYENNGSNSICQRGAFREIEILPGHLPPTTTFRAHVRTANYGDDVEGVVAKTARYYNMKTFAAYMATAGMTVTMPDKSPNMVEFLHWDDADFLKRTDSFIPELGVYLGKLSEESIFRSLHSNLRSKTLSKEQHAVAVMEGAAFEWWAHGRETYNRRTSELKEVCHIHNLHVPGLDKSFDDRVGEWKEQYSRPEAELVTAPVQE